LKYYLENSIIPFCLPLHTTHDLQPLDVGVFGPYQLYYGHAVDEEVRLSHGVLNIGKHNVWFSYRKRGSTPLSQPLLHLDGERAGLFPLTQGLSTVNYQASIHQNLLQCLEAALLVLQLQKHLGQQGGL
jgi:hypothetical protein